MIINCISCDKIFEVNAELIPSSGRTIQCGACGHIWFYKHGSSQKYNKIKEKIIKSNNGLEEKNEPNFEGQNLSKKIDKIINKKDTALIKYEKKPKLSFLNFLGFIIVAIISFIAMIIILDTFQTQLNSVFPNIELLLFNLYESNKDIFLFLRDLIK